MLRKWLMLPCLCLMALPVFAQGVDIAADTIVRDPYGAIVAEGDVIIRRKDETLKADQVTYDAANKKVEARGHVTIESEKATIRAESVRMHTAKKSGEMHKAEVTLKGGERLSAGLLKRQDNGVITAEDAAFTSCPPESEAWTMRASAVELDQEEGILTTKHARFEVVGVPVFYAPYWHQVLRRKSGFLNPHVANGKVRGTEVALPLYLAPADNWDVTLTPHWMTARGLMGETEFRFATQGGLINLQAKGIRDKKTSRQRSRLRADIEERLPFDIYFSADADHISDQLFLADFETDALDVSKRYLRSNASFSQEFEYGEWNLLASHRQNLVTPSNAATLHILPRFESGLHLPLISGMAILHLDQQTTQFTRTVGIHGTRLDLNPYLEIPMQFAGGGFQSTIEIGGRHTRYWLKGVGVAGSTMPTRNTFEASLDNRIHFERISENRRWRHTVTPILRYDYIAAPDQGTLPNFDSSFGQLTMNNLLTGNRFSGRDRIERLSRISAMLETGLQHKGSSDAPAHTYLQAKVGAAYELKRQTIDTALLAAPTRPYSDLLGEIGIHPTANIHLTADGQYDPAQKFWATAKADLTMNSETGHHLRTSWQYTDARYAIASEFVTIDAGLQLTRRWDLFGRWQFDLLLRQTQQGSGGLHYVHPCWDMRIEGYRYRLKGTNTNSDIGFRFLLGFTGLGSV